jgi:hypothetical protein
VSTEIIRPKQFAAYRFYTCNAAHQKDTAPREQGDSQCKIAGAITSRSNAYRGPWQTAVKPPRRLAYCGVYTADCQQLTLKIDVPRISKARLHLTIPLIFKY